MNVVLGIDLASASWTANGSALLEWQRDPGDSRALTGLDGDRPNAPRLGPRDQRGAITRVEPACIEWPGHEPLTSRAMADAIDACARRHGVRAVAIDGPHAWRDPARGSDGPGVGRWSEYLVRAQSKTGVCGQTYPRTQLAWASFAIAVFDALLACPGVRLADPADASHVDESAERVERAHAQGDPDDGAATPVAPPVDYLVLETYPTAIWRAAGLAPLPAKARRPDVAEWYARLAAVFDLPRDVELRGHDDLQAIVAALAAGGVAGGRAGATWHGHPCRVANGVRVEGGIWVATL